MAYRVVAGAGLQRTTNITQGTSDFTALVRFKSTANDTAPNYKNVLAQIDAGYTAWTGIFSEPDASQNYELDASDGLAPNQLGPFGPLAVGEWHNFAYVRSGFDNLLYLDGDILGFISMDFSANTFAKIVLGFEGFSTDSQEYEYYREWNVALSDAEIDAEFASTTPVRTANLIADTPLIDDILDDSGNGNDWSVVGTGGTLVPANNNWEAATVVPEDTLPYTDVLTVGFDGVSYDAWYKFTPVGDWNYIGIWGYSGDDSNPPTGYAPYVNVYRGDGTTFYLGNDSSTYPNRPIIIPITPGEDYYFQFLNANGDSTPSNLTVSIVAAPAPGTTVPIGSIFINDDGNEHLDDGLCYGGIFLTPTNGDNNGIIRFQFPFVAGEGGDVIQGPNVYLFEDFINDRAVLCDAQLNTIGVIAVSRGAGQKTWIRANSTLQNFYTFRRSNSSAISNSVSRVTPTGVTTEIFTFTGGGDAFAVNDDESLAYIAGKNGGSDYSIVTWNGSAFATFKATETSQEIRDMMFLGDGTLLVLRVTNFSPRDIVVKRYNEAGTLLNTYTIATGVSAPSNAMGYRLGFALDDPDTFWCWWHENDEITNDPGISHFTNVQVSDGTVLAHKAQDEYENGTYTRHINDDPFRFGNSSSCPFVIIVEEITGGGPPTTATLIVVKVVVPDTDPTLFGFTTAGGLDPPDFELTGGQQQSYFNLTPGEYAVNETPNPFFTTTYEVSNGDPHDAIVLAAGDTVTVTVTNTLAPPTPGTGSGMYKIEPRALKRNDTLWENFGDETTIDVKIPDPFIKTALLGE